MDYNIQTLTSVKTLCLVTLDQSGSIAKLDATSMSTNCDKYVSFNKFSYYVLLNTWAHQILSIASEEAWVYIWLRIQHVGLVPVIRDTTTLADMIIHGEAPDWDYTYGYLSVLANKDYGVFDPSLVELLSILRYPKRFSPMHADVITSASLKAFLELNTSLKDENIREPQWFWVRLIKEKIGKMLKGFSYTLDDAYFSSGTTATTNKLLLSKLKELAKTEANFGSSPLYPISCNTGYYPRWRNSLRLRLDVKVQAVPKSYKASRIIAKEPVYSVYNLQAISYGMKAALHANGYERIVDIERQDLSQELCRLGSEDGSLATIDLTSASDTISESFARSVLPSSVLTAIDQYRCAYINADGLKTHRVMQMFATSGNPITFITESIIFSAIAMVATEYVALITHQRLHTPRVYGDDIIIDDKACATCVEVLKECGFLPNLGKTFTGSTPLGFYRESCGVEYLNGYPMHHNYYPRKAIVASATGIAAVCELQHKLYGNWKVRMFLSQVIKTLEPKMTHHSPMTACEDLWDNVPTGIALQYKGNSSIHALRHKYFGLITKYPQNRPLNEDDRILLDMWYYYQYLERGPLYEDSLSHLLRVSTSRKRYAADSMSAEQGWGYRVE